MIYIGRTAAHDMGRSTGLEKETWFLWLPLDFSIRLKYCVSLPG